MKYLHDVFKEELSDESNFRLADGLVYIRSRYWSASDIVELARKSDGENEVFEELFVEWLQERIENKVTEADEILENFEQHDRFSSLIATHKAGSVIPFIGAGLSIPSGYPGWSHFLRKQRRQTMITEADLEVLLKQGDFEEAAQLIADYQGVAFNEAVDSTFGIDRDLAGAIQLLPHIFSGSIVTTNFDNVIERSFKNAGIAFLDKLSGFGSQTIRRRIASGERFLLMLHGTAKSGNGRILTKREYEGQYILGNTLEKTIKALCDTHNILFLGCSLTVDRTLVAIRSYINVEGHDNLPKHYAFLAAPDSNDERISRQNALSKCHIYPIWYPQGSHDESIEALLIKLHEATQ